MGLGSYLKTSNKRDSEVDAGLFAFESRRDTLYSGQIFYLSS